MCTTVRGCVVVLECANGRIVITAKVAVLEIGEHDTMEGMGAENDADADDADADADTDTDADADADDADDADNDDDDDDLGGSDEEDENEDTDVDEIRRRAREVHLLKKSTYLCRTV